MIRKSLAIVNTPYQLKVETRDTNGQKYLHGDLQVAAKIQYRRNALQVIEGNVEDHCNGTNTITLTPLTTGPHQLFITIDGQYIKNIPYDLEVKNSMPSYRTVNGPWQFNTSIMSPLCIAIHENGDVFICTSKSNCIYVLDQKDIKKSVIGSKGNWPGQFD